MQMANSSFWQTFLEAVRHAGQRDKLHRSKRGAVVLGHLLGGATLEAHPAPSKVVGPASGTAPVTCTSPLLAPSPILYTQLMTEWQRSIGSRHLARKLGTGGC